MKYVNEGESSDFAYHMANLKELDPDQLVNDLGLTTEQILARFKDEAIAFIYENYL